MLMITRRIIMTPNEKQARWYNTAIFKSSIF
jgi:hypothetical protein